MSGREKVGQSKLQGTKKDDKSVEEKKETSKAKKQVNKQPVKKKVEAKKKTNSPEKTESKTPKSASSRRKNSPLVPAQKNVARVTRQSGDIFELNSKQEKLLTKPTLIDKLISKNKSAIKKKLNQNKRMPERSAKTETVKCNDSQNDSQQQKKGEPSQTNVIERKKVQTNVLASAIARKKINPKSIDLKKRLLRSNFLTPAVGIKRKDGKNEKEKKTVADNKESGEETKIKNGECVNKTKAGASKENTIKNVNVLKVRSPIKRPLGKSFPVGSQRWKLGVGRGRVVNKGMDGIRRRLPYVTRSNSVLRNGKKRKCDDSTTNSDLNAGRKRKKIDAQNFEVPDDQSSFATDSDYSIFESVGTPGKTDSDFKDIKVKSEVLSPVHDVSTPIKPDLNSPASERTENYVFNNNDSIKTNSQKLNLHSPSDLVCKSSDVNLEEKPMIFKQSPVYTSIIDSKSRRLSECCLTDPETSDSKLKSVKRLSLDSKSDALGDLSESDASESGTVIDKRKEMLQRKKLSRALWVRRSLRSVRKNSNSSVISEILKVADNEQTTEFTSSSPLAESNSNLSFSDCSTQTDFNKSTDFSLHIEESPQKEDVSANFEDEYEQIEPVIKIIDVKHIEESSMENGIEEKKSENGTEIIEESMNKCMDIEILSIKDIENELAKEDAAEENKDHVEEVEDIVEEKEDPLEEKENCLQEMLDPLQEKEEDPSQEKVDPLQKKGDPLLEKEDPLLEKKDPLQENEDDPLQEKEVSEITEVSFDEKALDKDRIITKDSTQVTLEETIERNENSQIAKETELPPRKEILLDHEEIMKGIIEAISTVDKDLDDKRNSDSVCKQNAITAIVSESGNKKTDQENHSNFCDQSSNSSYISAVAEIPVNVIEITNNLSNNEWIEKQQQCDTAKGVSEVCQIDEKTEQETAEINTCPGQIKDKENTVSVIVKVTESNSNNSGNDVEIKETAEERANKESILGALGLQSLHTPCDDKSKKPDQNNYTGTLKAVIKLNRSGDKKSSGRKMFFKQSESVEDIGASGDRLEYRICSETDQQNETVSDGAAKKIQIKTIRTSLDETSNSSISAFNSNVVPQVSTDANKDDKSAPGKESSLVIPEKSSSFSIHPGRLCSDICSYCFGKFGSLDTPCHIAQLKNAERQSKVLAIETHLKIDSCLCDGCYRYVDRKANCPTSQRKKAQSRRSYDNIMCSVKDCTEPAHHSIRKKWLMKLRKSICKKLDIDVDKNPHCVSFPLCSQHYYWVDHFTVCGICKKRLNRNHMYSLGSEADDLNIILRDDGIPIRLSDKLFLCKLCRYYSTLRLKYRDVSLINPSNKLFLRSYRRKILAYLDIPVSESEEDDTAKSAQEDETAAQEQLKSKKRKLKSSEHDLKKRKTVDGKLESSESVENSDEPMVDYSYLDQLRNRDASTPVEYSTTIPGFEDDSSVDIASLLSPLENRQNFQESQSMRVNPPTRIQVKFGNLNIRKLSNLNIGQDSRREKEKSGEVKEEKEDRPPYLPGEKELPLSGELKKDHVGNNGWEKCTLSIQFDKQTRTLWNELQRPYGNQSSFLRHLVMLEKYWRSGSLVLADNADPRAVKYNSSVRNRIQSYEGTSGRIDRTSSPDVVPEITLEAIPPPVNTGVERIKTVSRTNVSPKEKPAFLKIESPQMIRPKVKTINPQGKSVYNVTLQPSVVRPYRVVVSSVANPTTADKKQILSVLSKGKVVQSDQLVSSGSQPIAMTYQQFKAIQRQAKTEQVLSSSSSSPTIANLVSNNIPAGTILTPNSTITVVGSSVPSTSTSTVTKSSADNFIPMICDVRSLAGTNTKWEMTPRPSKPQKKVTYFTPILPKVTPITVSQSRTMGPSVTLNSLTIEKAPPEPVTPNLVPEKPSISVFREDC